MKEQLNLHDEFLDYVLSSKCENYRVIISIPGYETVVAKGKYYKDELVNNTINVSCRNNKVTADLYTLDTSWEAKVERNDYDKTIETYIGRAIVDLMYKSSGEI